MRACIITALLLFASLVIAGGDPDACSLEIPASLIRKLSKNYPEHRFPLVADNSREDVANTVGRGGGKCLGVDSGDYNADKRKDFAILLSPKADAAPLLVVALRTTNDFLLTTLHSWDNTARSRIYVATADPGLYTRTEAVEGQLGPQEVATHTSKSPGVATGIVESMEIVYFFDGKDWIFVWNAD